MNIKGKLLSTAILICCYGTVLHTEPLPVGTVLSIETGNANVGDTTEAGACTVGSCFGLELAPGFRHWVNFGAGIDGGLVIGKNQVSGGQESGDSSSNTMSGEVTDAWYYLGYYGTVFTDVGDKNIFDDQSCIDAGCNGKTYIPSFDVAWNGGTSPLGDASVNDWGGTNYGGVIFAMDWQVNVDGSYYLNYLREDYYSPNARVILRGQILPDKVFVPPTAGPVVIDNISGLTTEWMPDITSVQGFPITCSIESQPAHGLATIDPGCIFGTYYSNDGYAGADNFDYTVSSGFISDTATVSVTVEPLQCEPYPVRLVTTVGGGQSQEFNAQISTTFTGRLTTERGLTTGAKNTVTICPGTTVEFESHTTVSSMFCTVNGAASFWKGTLWPGDKLICANRPGGDDVDRFVVKTGF